MKTKNIFILFLTLILFSSCGEGIVNIGEDKYQPKIVVEGYLSPNNPIENIKISRNYPINSSISYDDVYLSDADVIITDLQTNKSYNLIYDPITKAYKYIGNDLVIGYSKSYMLKVKAVIDGNNLYTKCITTTPDIGFKIHKELSILGEMKYREKDINENLKYFNIVFDPSPGTDFYIIATVAQDASVESFIYDNPYFEIKKDNVIKNFERYQYESKWIQNINTGVKKQSKNIDWIDTWFYGNYRTIMYAGDKNLKDYYITINQLQEMDGNYHEPKMYFDGDGIGIFGSFIADTVYFKIIK